MSDDAPGAAIGTTFELGTPAGLAYVQLVRHDPPTVRVLGGLHDDRPSDLAGLVASRAIFFANFDPVYPDPHNPCLRVDVFRVPEHGAQVPPFRRGLRHPDTGMVETWEFLDHDGRFWTQTTLEEGQRDWPIGLEESTSSLAHRIVSGWTPAQETSEPPASWFDEDWSEYPIVIVHDLAVATRDGARSIARTLRSWGYGVRIEPVGTTQRVSATGQLIHTVVADIVRERVEGVVRRAGGEYRGLEVLGERRTRACTEFFLYFATERQASAARDRLADAGYEAEVSSPDGRVPQWGVRATTERQDVELDQIDDEMEALASALGGEYDGHGVGLAW